MPGAHHGGGQSRDGQRTERRVDAQPEVVGVAFETDLARGHWVPKQDPIRFADYAEGWLQTRPLKPRTRAECPDVACGTTATGLPAARGQLPHSPELPPRHATSNEADATPEQRQPAGGDRRLWTGGADGLQSRRARQQTVPVPKQQIRESPGATAHQRKSVRAPPTSRCATTWRPSPPPTSRPCTHLPLSAAGPFVPARAAAAVALGNRGWRRNRAAASLLARLRHAPPVRGFTRRSGPGGFVKSHRKLTEPHGNSHKLASWTPAWGPGGPRGPACGPTPAEAAALGRKAG